MTSSLLRLRTPLRCHKQTLRPEMRYFVEPFLTNTMISPLSPPPHRQTNTRLANSYTWNQVSIGEIRFQVFEVDDNSLLPTSIGLTARKKKEAERERDRKGAALSRHLPYSPPKSSRLSLRLTQQQRERSITTSTSGGPSPLLVSPSLSVSLKRVLALSLSLGSR